MNAPTKRLSGQRNQCGACGQYFARTAGFTQHRTGSFTDDTRRCLSVSEMQERGFQLDVSGFWRMPGSGTNPWSKSKETA